MDRVIKFRGKRVDNNEWVYGHLLAESEPLQCCEPRQSKNLKHFIIFPGFADWNMPRPLHQVEVIPETVGQFTEMFDRCNIPIYEGDIIKCNERLTANIKYYAPSFMMDFKDKSEVIWGNVHILFNVIGNIYDK